MTHPTRRSFLRHTALATTALSASRVLGANDKIRIASIGLGGQGSPSGRSGHNTSPLRLGRGASAPGRWRSSGDHRRLPRLVR